MRLASQSGIRAFGHPRHLRADLRAEVARSKERDESGRAQIEGIEKLRAELQERRLQAERALITLALAPEEQRMAVMETDSAARLEDQALAQENLMESFEEDIRGPEILADCEAQMERVRTVRALVGGKADDVARARVVCDQARRDYHEYLRRFGERLGASFRQVCSDCGTEGVLEVRGLPEDRPYLHVAVAHNRGERLVSYRDHPHSGGQRAKISMLLLIAAMGLEGSTDFMMIDEPTAHMDGGTIRQVNELLAKLVHSRTRQIQYVFAVPTKGEGEAGPLVADQQILFFKRRVGESFNPPVVRMVRDVKA